MRREPTRASDRTDADQQFEPGASGWARVRGGAAVAVALIAGLFLAASPAAASITEFPVGFGPTAITTGPDGALWFTGEEASYGIGRITTGGTATGFTTPTAQFSLAIAAGSDGNLWFPEYLGNKIGRVDPTEVSAGTSDGITEFTIPTANSHPIGIAAGPDGNLWFTESNASEIGRVVPSEVSAGTSDGITEFPLPAGTEAGSIVAGPDGNLWFIASGSGNYEIGRITPAGTVTEFPMPTGSDAGFITAGPGGDLWFTAGQVNGSTAEIGSITTAGTITLLPVPINTSIYGDLSGLAAGSDGALWVTQLGDQDSGSYLYRITTTGAVTQFTTPTIASGPYGITSGPDGALWFVEQNADQIGRITTNTVGTFLGGGSGSGGSGSGGSGSGGSGGSGGAIAGASGLSISPRSFRAAASGASAKVASVRVDSGGPSATIAKHKKKKKKPNKTGATVTYTLSVKGSVRFTVEQSRVGRKKGKGKKARCVALTKKNHKKRKCKHLVTLRGSFTVTGKAGADHFHFSGRFAGKKLKPGNYTLVATPIAGSKTGRSITTTFRILKSVGKHVRVRHGDRSQVEWIVNLL